MRLIIKNKRGQEEGGGGFPTALALIILGIGIFILVTLVRKQIAFGGELSESAACTASIAAPLLSGEGTKSKCPITRYTVFNDAIKETKEGKTKDSEIVKDFSASEDKVNELFAKSMGSCLQRGGGVNSKAFSRGWLASKVCLECANIEFKDVNQHFSNTRDYLEKNNVPGRDKKYADYFAKDEAHREDWINFGAKNDHNLMPGKLTYSIDTNKIYTVFFIGIKEGTLSALADARVIGREDTYFVYAAEQENFNKVCDTKVN